MTVGPSSKDQPSLCHRFVKKVCLNTVKDKRDSRDLYTPEARLEKVHFSLGRTEKHCLTLGSDLARQLDRSHPNTEIPLIHLSGLLQAAFSICLRIALDSITDQLPLRCHDETSEPLLQPRAPEEDREEIEKENQRHSRC